MNGHVAVSRRRVVLVRVLMTYICEIQLLSGKAL
jgi:hypothetical protein